MNGDGGSARERGTAPLEGSSASLSAGLIVTIVAGLVWATIDTLWIPGPSRPGSLVLFAWVAFAPAMARLLHDDRAWLSSSSSALKTTALVLYGVLPFLALPFVATGLAGDCAALFIQPDHAYYYANGRAIFERGNGLLGPNAYDPSPDAPAIYGQWLLWLLGFLIVKLGLAATTVHRLLLLVGGLLVGALTLRLVRTVARPVDSGPAASLAFLAAMFGGGLFSLAGLLFSAPHDPVALDPAGGWWCLQWGRNLTLPIEAAYHAIVLAAWLAFRADRPIRGALFIALVAATHPFTGAEHLAVTGLTLTVLLAQRRRREHLIAWLITAVASLGFAAYYFVWLPSFPQHRALEQLWRDHDYTISLTASLLAYALVLLPIVLKLRTDQANQAKADSEPLEDSSQTEDGDPEGFRLLMMMTVGVVFLLSHHEWFMAPRQPAHFCRGYVWLPLFLLGLGPGLRALTALRERFGPRRLAFILSLGLVLFSLDNVVWLGRQAQQPPPPLVRLTPAMESVIHRLEELGDSDDVVLSTSHTLINMVPVLSPLKAYYGHVQCTPGFGARVQRARAFLKGEAPLEPAVEWLVIEAPLLDRLPRAREAFEPVETLAGYVILRRRRASPPPGQGR